MKKFIRKDDGSITLEAAMVLPFFMLFVVFLATIVRIAVADMALYKVAAETAEVAVAYAYPVEVSRTAAEELVENKLQSLVPDDIEYDDLKNWTNEALEFFDIDVAGTVENFLEGLTPSIVTGILQDKFEQTVGDTFFNPEHLRVTNVEIPSTLYGSGNYLEIEVIYEIPISKPFFNETITLSKTAAERVWTGS